MSGRLSLLLSIFLYKAGFVTKNMYIYICEFDLKELNSGEQLKINNVFHSFLHLSSLICHFTFDSFLFKTKKMVLVGLSTNSGTSCRVSSVPRSYPFPLGQRQGRKRWEMNL